MTKDIKANIERLTRLCYHDTGRVTPEFLALCEEFEELIKAAKDPRCEGMSGAMVAIVEREVEPLLMYIDRLEKTLQNVYVQLITALALSPHITDKWKACPHCRIKAAMGTLEEAISPEKP